jgi:hydrogenase maturation factor
MEVDLRKIPVKQETIEICEHFDINPYNVCSEGSILAAAKEGAALVEALVREGVPATLIGRLTDGNDRILWNDGNKRFLDRPQRDEIYKVKLK